MVLNSGLDHPWVGDLLRRSLAATLCQIPSPLPRGVTGFFQMLNAGIESRRKMWGNVSAAGSWGLYALLRVWIADGRTAIERV